MANERKYINFPISLLDGFMTNPATSLTKAINYAGDRLSVDGRQASVGIEKKTLMDFCRNGQKKTEKEKAVFLAYLAIKSIIGKEPFGIITKDKVLHRMAGHTKFEGEIPADIMRWGTRKRWEQLKYELTIRYGVEFFWDHYRYIYATTKLSLTDLAKTVLTSRIGFKKDMLKKMNRDQIQQAFTELGLGTT